MSALKPFDADENHVTEDLLSNEEINSIFTSVGDVFIFQTDNVKNMLDLFMSQLTSRSCRSTFYVALTSLHRDYVGDRSNYRKWYRAIHGADSEEMTIKDTNVIAACKQYVAEVALYLLIWGEASNLRFMPECLCFVFECCLRYYEAEERTSTAVGFLDNVVAPLFNFLRSQQLEWKDDRWVRRSQDHVNIIGYDDINLFFWHRESIERLTSESGILVDLAPLDRYPCFASVEWQKAFRKSYREVRTWSHLFTNFSRVWITHLTMFWFFTSFNAYPLYTKNYDNQQDNAPPPHVRWSVVALGGSLASAIALVACLLELRFVPRKYPGAQAVMGRAGLLFTLLVLCLGPSFYLLWVVPSNVYSRSGHIIGVAQFLIAGVTFLYLVLTPPAQYFQRTIGCQIPTQRVFTSDFQPLPAAIRRTSIALWVLIFTLKFAESYFFLTLSVKDPLKSLSHLTMSRCHGDAVLGKVSCRYQSTVTLVFILLTYLVLFFLDTYLWYVICTCMLSLILAMNDGLSMFNLWKAVFAQLPNRLVYKIVNTDNDDPILTASHIWNAIVYAMFREHLISVDQASALMYRFTDTEFVLSSAEVTAPINFFSHNPAVHSDEYYPPGGEAERRISYFTRSLGSPLPTAGLTTCACPAFTVLIPHYSETFVLSIKDVLRRAPGTQISLLDYLKSLLKTDWSNFVRDTRVSNAEKYKSPFANLLATEFDSQAESLPFECYGFKVADAESMLRTRIWASLHSQTLYRTVSGFMNYRHALAELYKAEHDDCIDHRHHLTFEDDLRALIDSKFTMLVSIQRYQGLSDEETEAFEIMAQNFPMIKVSILEEIKTGEHTIHYASQLDLARKDLDGNYARKYRIQLPGYPILGDGKSDNQNSSVIFYRGEYIQVVDSNQDNYLEECLKIKAVLSEFEELTLHGESEALPKPPVAIVGAREFIFSEQAGALGDVAAGKEQTFGTMFGRSLAHIQGKLHYGHPDFLNGIYMCTRGGLSKAQRSLHLNEDIYAGMNAIARGGRIKHVDYYQCGKGRDLGFDTILNFTSKIGAGMAEQTLSREQYFFGTQLPTDRLLSFYYAHPGFHINNVFIILSIQLFLIFLLNIGSLRNESTICDGTGAALTPIGCYDIKQAVEWIDRYVLSVVICFFLSFTPLITQEFMERGVLSTCRRILFHLMSLSPLFEVCVCRVYAKAFVDNRSHGGARYISTGRGFAITRNSFSSLYTRYAPLSIYWGCRLTLLIVFACTTVWLASLMWFWITCLSLCLSPFLFNPHQFRRSEFFLDYREYIGWLSRGNHSRCKTSWVNHARHQTVRQTGLKKNGASNAEVMTHPVSMFRFGLGNIVKSLVNIVSFLAPYMFMCSQNGVAEPVEANPLMRVAALVTLPLMANMLVLVVLFCVSVFFGPMVHHRSFANTMAAFAHGWSVFVHLVVIEVTWYLHSWNLSRSLACFCLSLTIQRHLLKLVLGFCLSKESNGWETNAAWWSGRWIHRNFGWHVFSQPLRELGLKVVELNMFAYDFFVGHVLLYCLSVFLLVPYIDKVHSLMMFWHVRSSSWDRIITHELPKRQRSRRNRRVWTSVVLFAALLVANITILIAPYLTRTYWQFLTRSIPKIAAPLIHPNDQDQNDTGTRAPLSYFSGTSPLKTWSTVW